MKTIAPNNLIVYVVVALIKGVEHFGMPTSIKNVEVSIDGELANYPELDSIEAIKSSERDYDYLDDVTDYLNEQVGEEVLKTYGDFVEVRKEYRGEYTFLYGNDGAAFFCHCKTVSRGMVIIG